MHETYGDQGLKILAFPCNNFGGQEPGSNADVAKYVQGRGATFTVVGKIECDNGDKTHPVYRELMDATDGQGLGWNFHKFLCDANGSPVLRSSKDPEALIPDIEKLLGK